LGDGSDFVVVKGDGRSPKKIPLWKPVRLSGRWHEDEWGNDWFEMKTIVKLTQDATQI
jgi:hypothetical protein